MRVLYICSEYRPAQTAVAVRSRFNVQALQKQGVDVCILTCAAPEGTPPDKACDNVVRLSLKPLSNLNRLPVRLAKEILLGFAFGCRLLALRNRMDLIILTSPPFFTMAIVASFCWSLSLRFAFDVRDRYPQTFFSLGLLSKIGIPGRLLLAWEKFVYRKATMTVTVTAALSNEIAIETGVKPKIVMNGFDAETIQINSNKFDSTLPKVIFMHGLFGRLFDVQSFGNIVNFCGTHAGPHCFVIAGYGPSLKDILTQRLYNIQYVGHLSHQDVVKLLASADIGLSVHTNQPSTNAGFAVKVFEFIGAGIPSVVIPRNESGVEIEREGLGWTFDNKQWEDCARLLTDIIDGRVDTTGIRVNIATKRNRYSRQAQSLVFADHVRVLGEE